mmetsp:Transcript_18413/g.47173  ORF Transcript_18413/g.47173 Transcript_18413/m.47173 type:complete len:220 (+) Transcript_18413:606-1265(+)
MSGNTAATTYDRRRARRCGGYRASHDAGRGAVGAPAGHPPSGDGGRSMRRASGRSTSAAGASVPVVRKERVRRRHVMSSVQTSCSVRLRVSMEAARSSSSETESGRLSRSVPSAFSEDCSSNSSRHGPHAGARKLHVSPITSRASSACNDSSVPPTCAASSPARLASCTHWGSSRATLNAASSCTPTLGSSSAASCVAHTLAAAAAAARAAARRPLLDR